jgi:hypothetical protein
MCQLTVSEVREYQPPYFTSPKAVYFRDPEDAYAYAEKYGGKVDGHCAAWRVMKEKVA